MTEVCQQKSSEKYLPKQCFPSSIPVATPIFSEPTTALLLVGAGACSHGYFGHPHSPESLIRMNSPSLVNSQPQYVLQRSRDHGCDRIVNLIGRDQHNDLVLSLSLTSLSRVLKAVGILRLQLHRR